MGALGSWRVHRIPVEIVVDDVDVAWFRPKPEVGWQNMLVGEIEHADRPRLMIASEEAKWVVLALIHNRNQFVLRCHHLKLV
jgi:hypothetical protein